VRNIAIQCLLAATLVASCTPLHVERQRLFLSFIDSSGGPAPFVCSVSFFDRGLVEYSCGMNNTYVAQLSNDQLATLHDMIHSEDWQRTIDSIASTDYSGYQDYPELHVYYRAGQRDVSTYAPTEYIPPKLLPHLRRTDALLRSLFGSHVLNHFEPSRNAA
jgi:hypothetical protein